MPQVFDVDKGDRGWVYLDEKEVPLVKRCCPAHGWVISLAVDDRGQLKLQDGRPREILQRGKVEFVPDYFNALTGNCPKER